MTWCVRSLPCFGNNSTTFRITPNSSRSLSTILGRCCCDPWFGPSSRQTLLFETFSGPRDRQTDFTSANASAPASHAVWGDASCSYPLLSLGAGNPTRSRGTRILSQELHQDLGRGALALSKQIHSPLLSLAENPQDSQRDVAKSVRRETHPCSFGINRPSHLKTNLQAVLAPVVKPPQQLGLHGIGNTHAEQCNLHLIAADRADRRKSPVTLISHGSAHGAIS